MIEIIGAIQGVFFLGITIIIIYYYAKMPREHRLLQYHILSIATSYNLLAGATLLTLHRNIFPLFDMWTVLVFSAYALGDYALITMFIHLIKKQKHGNKTR